MKIGYIIASHEVTKKNRGIRYLYREQPTDELDSGWRVFSGEETQEYADDPNNFSMYNASTIVEIEPRIAALLDRNYPVSFERDAMSEEFKEIIESEYEQ